MQEMRLWPEVMHVIRKVNSIHQKLAWPVPDFATKRPPAMKIKGCSALTCCMSLEDRHLSKN